MPQPFMVCLVGCGGKAGTLQILGWQFSFLCLQIRSHPWTHTLSTPGGLEGQRATGSYLQGGVGGPNDERRQKLSQALAAGGAPLPVWLRGSPPSCLPVPQELRVIVRAAVN